MTVFRWILFGLCALMAACTALSFGVFIATGIDVWQARALAARRWLYAASLLWFNVEIWRRVVQIIVNW